MKTKVTFTYGILLVVSILMIAVLLVVSYGDVTATPINYREWLLEYEQVEAYPAPPAVVTPTYILPYPAPLVELTETEEPVTLIADVYKILPTSAPTMDVLLPYPAPPTYAPPYPAPPYPAPPTYAPPYPAPPYPAPPYPAPPTYTSPYPAPYPAP